MTEIEALIILSSISSMGPVRVKNALVHFGSALAALEASSSEVMMLFGEKIASAWTRWKQDASIQKNFELIHRFQATVIPFTSPEYPQTLLELHDHPIVLYICGELKPSDAQAVAMIGTRDCSIYGREMASTLSRDLAGQGFTIVSGLARGIDTAAHQGALMTGRTLAVIGSGLANLYPRENKGLADQIVRQGALVSEFPMETPPDRQNFPQRNRIVSGLSRGVVLVEAPIRSGAILTMERALKQKKKLFALPGRADLESFRGNHAWIKEGKARLIENVVDIANEFGSLLTWGTGVSIPKMQVSLAAEEKELWEKLPSIEVQLETISQMTQLPASRLNVLLMGLVLKKAVKEFPGKIYKKCVHV